MENLTLIEEDIKRKRKEQIKVLVNYLNQINGEMNGEINNCYAEPLKDMYINQYVKLKKLEHLLDKVLHKLIDLDVVPKYDRGQWIILLDLED